MKFTREALSNTEAGKMIQNQKAIERKQEYREKIIEDPNHGKKNYEHGWIQLGKRVLFVRSRWEANICAYMEFLKDCKKIVRWGYEQKTFWFKNITRGTNNYKPDFVIEDLDGHEIYIEVKGYWTRKDTVKMKRMKKYYPYVELSIIADERTFAAMRKDHKDLEFKEYGNYNKIAELHRVIPNWNQPFLKREQIEHLIPQTVKKVRTKKS